MAIISKAVRDWVETSYILSNTRILTKDKKHLKKKWTKFVVLLSEYILMMAPVNFVSQDLSLLMNDTDYWYYVFLRNVRPYNYDLELTLLSGFELATDATLTQTNKKRIIDSIV